MNKPLQVLTLIAAMGFCGAANATAWVDLYYGAHIDLTVFDSYTPKEFSDTQQTLAVGSLSVSAASTTVSAAEANLNGGVLLNVQTTNLAGEGASAVAYVHDTLTFHVIGGGSADVFAQMSGSWAATGNDAIVTYAFSADGLLFSGQADPYTTSYKIGYDSITSSTISGGSAGTYTNGGLWHVQDGHAYYVRATVTAGTGGNTGGTANINDPLTFLLPGGVTFTSASGSTYVSSVPLPAAVWLFGSSLIGLISTARLTRR